MRPFLKTLALFLSGFLLIMAIGIALPAPPRVKDAFIFAYPLKMERLAGAPSPRIILIGGSNLSFSMDSALLEELTGYHVVNLGLAANLGLYFMLDSVLPDVRPGDLVVAAPEYDHYFGDFAYGNDELLRVVLDVAPREARHLRPGSVLKLLPMVPAYALSKYKPQAYVGLSPKFGYRAESFNGYGDVDVHWDEPQMDITVYDHYGGTPNPEVFDELAAFAGKVADKGAAFLVTWPSFQRTSLERNRDQKAAIERRLHEWGLSVLGRPEDYAFPDDWFWDTSYHLRGEGVKARTGRLAGDLESHLKSRR